MDGSEELGLFCYYKKLTVKLYSVTSKWNYISIHEYCKLRATTKKVKDNITNTLRKERKQSYKKLN